MNEGRLFTFPSLGISWPIALVLEKPFQPRLLTFSHADLISRIKERDFYFGLIEKNGSKLLV